MSEKEEVELLDLHYDKRRNCIETSIRHSIVPMMIDSLGQILKDSNAKNFLTFEGEHAELGKLIVTIQKAEGETTAEQLTRKQKELEEAKKVAKSFAQSWSKLWYLCWDMMQENKVLRRDDLRYYIEDTYIDDDNDDIRRTLDGYDTRNESLPIRKHLQEIGFYKKNEVK